MTPPFAAHIAYVQLDPSRPAHPGLMGDEAEPQVEFERFTLRNGASNLVLNRPRDGAHPVARLLHWAGRIGRSFNLLRDTAGAFDAYLATGEDIGIPLALASLAFVRKTPIHITFHGHYIGGVRFALAMKVLRRFRHIHWHPLSTSLHGIMRHQLRIPKARCHNTGYAVDTDFFTPVARAGSVIGSAGLAFRDYATLVSAAQDLDTPVKIAAASTWLRTNVDLGLGAVPSHIEIRSFGNYQNLRELYAASRFVVVPLQDRCHACGYSVIAEAMAMGKAVITTKTHAPSDFLVEGVTGYYVDPNDAAQLRNRIELLNGQPGLAAQLGDNARRLMGDYTLDRMCERLEQAISESLAESASPTQGPATQPAWS